MSLFTAVSSQRFNTLILLTVIFMSFSGQVLALTYKEYLAKLPDYLDPISSDDEEKKRITTQRFQVFAPILIRGFHTLLQHQDEASAQTNFDEVMHGIATQEFENEEGVYVYIVSQFSGMDMQPLVQNSSFLFGHTVIPPALDVASAELLRTLGRLSISFDDGQVRLVMHGGMAMRARMCSLYGCPGTIEPADWDFILRPNAVGELLETLQLSQASIQRFLLTLQQPSEECYEEAFFGLSTVRLTCHHRIQANETVRLIKLQQFRMQEGKKVFKRIMNIDFYLSEILPEAEYLFFESIGWLPVHTVEAALMDLRKVLNMRPERRGHYLSKLEMWRHLERAHNKLKFTPKLLGQLMIDDVPITAPGTIEAVSKSPGKKKEKKTKRVLAALPMPELPVAVAQEKPAGKLKQTLKRLRQKRSRDADKKADYDRSQSWLENVIKVEAQCAGPSELVKPPENEEMLKDQFKILTKEVNRLTDFHKDVEFSIFFRRFEEFCSNKCTDCRYTKIRYYDFLSQYLVKLSKAYDGLRQSVPETSRDPVMRNIAAQAQALSTALVLLAIEQGELMSDIAKSIPGCRFSPVPELPDPFEKVISLYSSLYAHYTQLRQIDSGLSRAFQGLTHQWSGLLSDIEARSRRLVPANGQGLVQLITGLLQISVITENLDSLVTSLPDALEEIKAQDSGDFFSSETKELLTMALAASLSSNQWLSIYEQNVRPTNQLRKMLAAVQCCPLLDSNSQIRTGIIINKWDDCDRALEKQKQQVRERAERYAREFDVKKEALTEVRQNYYQEVDKLACADKDADVCESERIEVPVYQPPVPQWRITYNNARQSYRSGQYGSAIKQLKKALKLAPESDRVMIQVELADISWLLMEAKLKTVQTLREEVDLLHATFYASAQSLNQGSSRIQPPAKNALIDISEKLQGACSKIGDDLKQSLTYHEEALNVLDSQSDADQTGLNRELLACSLDMMKEFHKQTANSWEQLKEAVEFRKQWLTQYHVPGEELKPDSRNDILRLKLIISRQSERHQTIFDRSLKLYDDTRVKITEPEKSVFSLGQYQRFSVPGDGDCLFSSLALALNNLQGTADWNAGKIRRRIHDTLKKVIQFIHGSPQAENLQAELSAVLGLDFATLELIVDSEVLVQGTATNDCVGAILQQYGEINYVFLLQLTEYIPVGVQLSSNAAIQNYNPAIWLDLAPSLLSQLVQQGWTNVQSWHPALAGYLTQGEAVPSAVQEQIQQTSPHAVLIHSGTNPLQQHFEVAIPTISSASAQILNFVHLGSIFLLKLILTQSVSRHSKRE